MESEIKNFNLVQANEQKKEQDILNNKIYKTKASDEYFEQFNKTTRWLMFTRNKINIKN